MAYATIEYMRYISMPNASIEDRETALSIVGDFCDAIDEAVNELHSSIHSNILTDSRDDIERGVMEWSALFLELSNAFHAANKNERRLILSEQHKAKQDALRADHIRQERKDAGLS